MNKKTTIDGPIYDARQLGTPKMLLLGLQHMFAMFGATVLVPALTGLDVATALLFAGIGTLLFHLLTGGKVPAFLGSSFAFIGGYNAIRTIGAAADGSPIYDNALLPYACFGVLIAGLMYVILSVLFKTFGVKKVMRFFPPIVTGPIIIAIGLTLSSSAINNCKANWLVAIVAIAIVIGFNMWGKGMTKIIPILLGVLGSYIFALIVDPAERAAVSEAVSNAAWIGLPVHWNHTVFGLFAGEVDSSLLWSAVFTIVPLSLATMVEHIGDICAISSTVGKNFMSDPGFHRTLLGDGLATSLAALFGGPANTTYGENTGALLFEVRSKRLEMQPGEICFPGGRIESGETPERAALRELWEELRIPSWQVTLLGPMDKMVHFSGTVYPQVGRVATEAMNALYPNPDEVEEVFTVPLEYFLTQPRKHYTYHMTPNNLQELPEPLAEYVRHYKQTFVTPVWFYEGHTIWGMTARAVEAFLKFFEA